MNNHYSWILLFLLVLCAQSALCTTLVYSLKIRRSFESARQILDKQDKSIWAFTVLPIVSSRKRHILDDVPLADIREKRLLAGAVFNLRAIPSDSSWFEITGALANERAKARGTTNSCSSRTGFDDIVLSAGYNMEVTQAAQIVFYGIAGFPTRWKVTLEDALAPILGIRLFGAGFGAEFSYAFIQSLKRALIATVQNRYIHFFKRDWYPILPCGSKIQPGNTIDLLIALRFREKREIFEAGYNPTFFLNQAVITPIQKIRGDDFVRQGGYITYTHLFDSFAHPLLVGAGVAYSKQKFLDTSILSGWLNFTVLF